MAISFTQYDINLNNNPVDCVVLGTIGSPAVTMVLVWNQLSPSDQAILEAMDAASPSINFPPAGGYNDLVNVILPNGMNFLSTYSFAIKQIVTTPSVLGNVNDYDHVYYDGTDWKRVTTGTVVP